ncbi:MAG: DNRLRE domain-containing protein [Bacteroidales bacterium]
MKKLLLLLLLIPVLKLALVAQPVTLTLRPGLTNGKDAMIHGLATQVSNNFGGTYELTASAWTYGNPVGITRSLIGFDLSVIPAGAIIQSASLSLYAWDMFNGTGSGQHSTSSGSNSAYIERVMSPWDEMTVTWDTQPSTTNLNQVTIPASTSPSQNYPNIDVTAMVTDMIANPASSHGFMIKLVTEVHYRRLNFCSSEHPDSLKRPMLQITYLPGTPPPQPMDSCSFFSVNELHICKGDSVMVYGTYRKTAGVYTDTLASIINTDSVLITAVHVHDPAVHFIAHDLCDGDSIWAAGAWQSETGFYLDTYSGSVGCDSLVYNLVKHTQIYTAVLRNGSTLSSIEPGALYQWVDCNNGFTPITGATSQTFTPAVNGSYAVMIFKENCVGLSSCILVDNLKVKSIASEDVFRIAPNPTSGKTMVEFGRMIPAATISISTLNGQELQVVQLRNASMVEVDLTGFAKGFYTVTVTIEGSSTAQTIVLE